MTYTVTYTQGAVRQLKKPDRHIRALLMGWIEKNLVDCTDPRRHGKQLTAERSGQWRYRIGDYRLIADISDRTMTILISSWTYIKEGKHSLERHTNLSLCFPEKE